MDHSTGERLHKTIVIQEALTESTTEYEVAQSTPFVISITRKSMRKNKGKGKTKESPEDGIELTPMMNRLSVCPSSSNESTAQTNSTSKLSAALTLTKSRNKSNDTAKSSDVIIDVKDDDDDKEDSFDESQSRRIARLLTGRPQAMLHNQLFEAKLPYYDEVNESRSALDFLSRVGDIYCARNWKPGFKTTTPLKKGFATNVFWEAENEYLKKIRQQRTREQAWTEVVRREKMERSKGLGFVGSLNPARWRSHGKVLEEDQDPPEPSCKIEVATKCGYITHRWYVKCHRERPFLRTVHSGSFCGEEGCKEHPTWSPGDEPQKHEGSMSQWVEVDPEEIDPGVKKRKIPMDPRYENEEDPEESCSEKASQDCFPVWMLSWLEKGPPDECISKCMKVSIITKCGLVQGRLLILCDQHTKGDGHCAGDREHLIILDRACTIGKDKNRCEVRNLCDAYIRYWQDKRHDTTLSHEERMHIAELSRRLNEAYAFIKKNWVFLRHAKSVRVVKNVWVMWMNNSVGYYKMLSMYGLKAINPLTHI